MSVVGSDREGHGRGGGEIFRRWWVDAEEERADERVALQGI